MKCLPQNKLSDHDVRQMLMVSAFFKFLNLLRTRQSTYTKLVEHTNPFHRASAGFFFCCSMQHEARITASFVSSSKIIVATRQWITKTYNQGINTHTKTNWLLTQQLELTNMALTYFCVLKTKVTIKVCRCDGLTSFPSFLPSFLPSFQGFKFLPTEENKVNRGVQDFRYPNSCFFLRVNTRAFTKLSALSFEFL